MKDIVAILTTIAGIATLALIVRNAGGVSQLITSGASAYAGLISTATGFGAPVNAFGR